MDDYYLLLAAVAAIFLFVMFPPPTKGSARGETTPPTVTAPVAAACVPVAASPNRTLSVADRSYPTSEGGFLSALAALEQAGSHPKALNCAKVYYRALAHRRNGSFRYRHYAKVIANLIKFTIDEAVDFTSVADMEARFLRNGDYEFLFGSGGRSNLTYKNLKHSILNPDDPNLLMGDD